MVHLIDKHNSVIMELLNDHVADSGLARSCASSNSCHHQHHTYTVSPVFENTQFAKQRWDATLHERNQRNQLVYLPITNGCFASPLDCGTASSSSSNRISPAWVAVGAASIPAVYPWLQQHKWILTDGSLETLQPRKKPHQKSDFPSQKAHEHNCGHPGERGKKSKSPKPKNNSFHTTTIFKMNPPPQKPTSHQWPTWVPNGRRQHPSSDHTEKCKILQHSPKCIKPQVLTQEDSSFLPLGLFIKAEGHHMIMPPIKKLPETFSSSNPSFPLLGGTWKERMPGILLSIIR